MTHPDFTEEQIAAFWSHVDQSGGADACWPWTRSRSQRGYGQLVINGRSYKAHRMAFFLEHGHWPQPYGLHSCDRPPCCNPAHLFEGTQDDNMKDCAAKGRASHTPKSWGESHWHAKMTGQDVDAMRQEFSAGRASLEDLCRRYGLKKGGAHSILKGKSWKDRPSIALCNSAPIPLEQRRNIRLGPDAVRTIRERHAVGGVTHDQLAQEFDVCRQTISLILSRKTWKHI
jgi:hypothetical protein